MAKVVSFPWVKVKHFILINTKVLQRHQEKIEKTKVPL